MCKYLDLCRVQTDGCFERQFPDPVNMSATRFLRWAALDVSNVASKQAGLDDSGVDIIASKRGK